MRNPFHRRAKERLKAEMAAAEKERHYDTAAPQPKPEKDTRSDIPPTLPPIPNDVSIVEGDSKASIHPVATREDKASDLTRSEIVWNRAYDELANEDSALVEGYVRVLPKATGSDEDTTEFVGEMLVVRMKDPYQRQAIMKNALASGQKKVEKSAKATSAVGKVSDFVLKFKEVIDLAVSTNPQAALPWAGACIGLQFLLNPAQASQSQMEGIAYVLTRMKWYCALVENMLSRENIETGGKPYDDLLAELENRVVALYKALLTYQMKSVCQYYKSQGLVWLRNTINLDDWDGQLAGVKSAENAVQTDSNTYLKFQTRDTLSKIAKSGEESQNILSDLNLTLHEYVADQKEEKEDRKKKMQEANDTDTVLGVLAFDKSSDTWDSRTGAPKATWETAHQNILKQDVAGTGEWLFSEPLFQAWEDVEKDTAMLALVGGESSGKSYLASSIIHHLRRNEKHRDLRRVVGFHFMDKRKKNTGIDVLSKSLIWQIAKGDGSYMQSAANTCRDSGTIDPRRILPELLFEKYDLKDIKAAFYIIINKLGSEGDVVDSEIVSLLQQAKQSKNRTFRIIFTCNPSTFEQLENQGVSCPSLAISEKNGDDILKFIDSRMNNIDALSDRRQARVSELREKVKTSLKDKAEGDYFKISTALDKIRSSDYVDEIDTILNNAGKDTNDHVQGEIDKLNELRTSKEVSEINEILLWVANSQERLSVEEMTALLQLSSNATSLRSLDYKFKTSYFLFQIGTDGFIELRSSKYLKLIPQRRAIAQENQREDQDIHPKELEIVQHFLNTVCPPELLKKLQINEYFQRKMASKNCQIWQEDKDTAHARIAADLLRVLAMEEDADLSVLQGYAARQLMQHLSMVDLALVDRDLKSQIGPGLVKLFTDDTCIDSLFRFSSSTPGEPAWMWEDSTATIVQNWLKDSAVVSNIDPESQWWIDQLKKDSVSALLKLSAVRMASHCLQEPAPLDLATATFKFILQFYAKTSGASTNLDSPLASEIQEAETWSEQVTEVTERDALWEIQMALVFQAFHMMSFSEERCRKALELESLNWRALHILAQVIDDDNEAIKILIDLIDRVEKDVPWMELHWKHLSKMACDLGDRYWQAGNLDKAFTAHSKSIEYDSTNAMRFLEILSRYQLLDRWINARDLVETLQSLGENRLVTVIIELAMEKEFHEILHQIAIMSSESQTFIKSLYADAINHALEDGEYNAMLYLKCFQARVLSRLPKPPVDTIKELMEGVLEGGFQFAVDPEVLLNYLGSILGRIYYNETLQEVSSGLDPVDGGSNLLLKTSKISCEQVTDYILECPARMWYARYCVLQDNRPEALRVIRNDLQLVLELLSDDDLSNDIWAFMRLSQITVAFLDEKNTATAYAMEAFGLASLINAKGYVGDDLRDIPDNAERRWEAVRECDVCAGGGDRPGGLWVCPDCIQVNLCSDCRTKLHEGAFIKNICDPSHEGFFVEGWTPKRLESVPVGYVPWGDEDITMEEWKNVLREKYLPNDKL